MPKNLVLCCDGTNNQFAGDHTNVIRTYKVARRHPGQLTYYDPGVGTMPEPWVSDSLGKRVAMLKGLVYGQGFMENILDAYRFVVTNYEPGDNVYIFGFSRGAYTARAVAAMLHSIGLVYPATENLLSYAQNYWLQDFGGESDGGKICAEFKQTLSRPCPVHFIGVWDTVGSVGYFNNFRKFPYTMRNPDVTYVRHAVSIDERRSTFRQNLMVPTPVTQDIKNVYFAGVHSDVGGGYKPEESGLAKITFEWMMREAKNCGLDVDPVALDHELTGVGAAPDPSAPLHKSLHSYWWLGELLPMRRYSFADHNYHWHWIFGAFNQPRDVERTAKESYVFLHQSVLERIKQRADYRPKNLPPNEASIRAMFKIEV